MSLASVLADGGGRRLRMVVTIDGWPFVLWESNHTFTLPTGPGYTGQIPVPGCITSDGIDETATEIDPQTRMQVGGGCTITAIDAAGLLRTNVVTRQDRVTFIADTVSKTATTIEVKNASVLPSSGIIYVGGETIAYTGKSGDDLTGCTRGAFGSPAQVHVGDAVTGAGVYLYPPAWRGRRVRLWGYAVDAAELPIAETMTPLGVFVVERGPREVQDNRWVLQCGHLLSELNRAKLGTGIKWYEIDSSRLAPEALIGGNLVIEIPLGFASAPFTQGDSQLTQHAVCKFNSNFTDNDADLITVFRIFDVDQTELIVYQPPLTTRNGVQMTMADLMLGGAFFTPDNFTDPRGYSVAAVKHITVLADGVPYVLLLYALTSRLGDGANGSFDVLPGIDAPFGATRLQMGAGLDANEIDVASLQALAEHITPGWSFVIDEEIPVTDLLRDFMLAADAYCFYSLDGKLTFRRWAPTRADTVASLTRSDFIDADIDPDFSETDVTPRVTLICNRDPLTEEFRARVNVVDTELADARPTENESVEILSRSIVVRPVNDGMPGAFIRPTVSSDDVSVMLRRLQRSGEGGRLIVSGTLPERYAMAELGSTFALSLAGVTDYQGNSTIEGIGRLVARGPKWGEGGVVLCSFDVLPRVSHFAASAVISSVSDLGGGAWELTLDTAHPQNADASPADAFLNGDQVRIVDDEGFTPRTATLSADGNVDKINITGASGSPVAGDVVLLRTRALATDGGDRQGFTRNDYAYMQDDDESGSPFLTRWS